MDDETELLNAWNGLLHGKEKELGELLKTTDVRNAMFFHCFHFYIFTTRRHNNHTPLDGDTVHLFPNLKGEINNNSPFRLMFMVKM